MKMKLFDRRNGGFTLVELIVVIAILAILAGIAIPVYTGYIAKAKEAADYQLLDAVNICAAGAVLEATGKDMANLPDGALTATINPVTVTDPDNSNVATAFAKYYTGNEGSEFKVFTGLEFVGGVFAPAGEGGSGSGATLVGSPVSNGDGTTTYTFKLANGNTVQLTVDDEAVANVKASTFGENMDEILDTVGTVVDAAASVVNNPSLIEAIVDNIYGSGYAASVGISSDDENYASKLSNALVGGVARDITNYVESAGMDNLLAMLSDPNTVAYMSTMTSDDLRNMVMSPEGNGLSNLTLMYGMMSGYANSETGKTATVNVNGTETSLKDYFDSATADLYNSTGGTDALTKIVAITNTMASSDKFQTYVDNEAAADFTGLVSAMQQINANNDTLVSGDGLNVLEEGYTSGSVSDILTSIFSN